MFLETKKVRAKLQWLNTEQYIKHLAEHCESLVVLNRLHLSLRYYGNSIFSYQIFSVENPQTG